MLRQAALGFGLHVVPCFFWQYFLQAKVADRCDGCCSMPTQLLWHAAVCVRQPSCCLAWLAAQLCKQLVAGCFVVWLRCPAAVDDDVVLRFDRLGCWMAFIWRGGCYK